MPGERGQAGTTLGEFGVRVAIAMLIVLLLAGLAMLAWSGMEILFEAFAGALLAICLATMANWTGKQTGLPYGWSLLAVIVGCLAVGGALVWLLFNRLATQLTELTVEQLPRALIAIRDYLNEFEWGRMLIETVPPSANQIVSQSTFAHLTGLISGLEGVLTALIVILVVGIFGAAEPQVYRSGLMHLVPRAHRRRADQAIEAVAFNLRHWLLAQLFLMSAIGVTTTIGLWLLGVPMALALGVIAGALEMVPYIGPWISLVPAALIALLVSPLHLVGVLVLYLFIHILEGYVLMPLVQRQSVHLAPAFTLVAQILLGKVFGILGLFVAAPLTICAVVLIKMFYVEDTLDDKAVEIPGEPTAKYTVQDYATRTSLDR